MKKGKKKMEGTRGITVWKIRWGVKISLEDYP